MEKMEVINASHIINSCNCWSKTQQLYSLFEVRHNKASFAVLVKKPFDNTAYLGLGYPTFNNLF